MGSVPAGVTLRLATLEDCGAIDAIYNPYVLGSCCTYQEVPGTLPERERWLREHGPAHPVIVAELDGAVAGWGALGDFRGRSGYRHCVENSVYVRRELHRRGIGDALLGDLIGRARVLGHRSIVAGIDAEQAGSIALHARHGFVECARLREVGFKFGRWRDVVFLQLLLAEVAR